MFDVYIPKNEEKKNQKFTFDVKKKVTIKS